MSPYALTYPQLVAQFIAAGFGEDRLARLRTIHYFAERMADGEEALNLARG